MLHDPTSSSLRSNYPEIGTPELRRQVSKELRSARELDELSLEQVSASTKINPRHLEAIERGDWSFLPPPYIKAFIRSYAQAVGVLTDKLERQLDEAFADVAVSPPSPPDLSEEDLAGPRAVTPTQTKLTEWAEQNRSLIFYGLLGIIIAALVIYYISRPSQSPVRIEGNELESEDVTGLPELEPINVDSVLEAGKQPPPPKQVPYSLRILAEDTCYIKVESPDFLLYERTLWPGNRVALDPDTTVKISLGNAPGVMILVGNDTLPRFPEDRRVRVVNISRGGFVR